MAQKRDRLTFKGAMQDSDRAYARDADMGSRIMDALPNFMAPQTVIVGQKTDTTTPEPETFYIKNIKNQMGGYDPREDANDTEEEIKVYTLDGEIPDTDVWVSAFLADDDQWYMMVGGSAGSPTTVGSDVVPFRLWETKQNTSPTAWAKLVDGMGNVIIPPAWDQEVADEAARLALVGLAAGWKVRQLDVRRVYEYEGGGESDASSWKDLGWDSADITVVDKSYQQLSSQPAGLFGYAQYNGANGVTQDGFLGEARFNGDVDYGGYGRPGYEIISIEGLAPVLLVTLAEEGGASSLDTNLREIYGSNYCTRVPEQSGTAQLRVTDTNSLTDGVPSGTICTVAKISNSDQYEVIDVDPPDPAEKITIAVLDTFIDPATVATTGVTPGRKTGITIMEYSPGPAFSFAPKSETGIVLNMSKTKIEGTVAHPVAVAVALLKDSNAANEDEYLIIGAYDLRHLPNFDENTYQIPAHAMGSSQFELVNFCYDHNYVTEVIVEANEMKYKYPNRNDFCTIEETKIIDIGPCDTTP